MQVRITRDGTVLLTGPDDFRRFSILFDPGARGSAPAEAALARVARPDGDAAWVSEAALRDLAPRAGEADWQEGFAGMVAYARGRGWVDDQGAIRAHIETVQAATRA
ncbi:hypothetical protein [Muricoccus radiodurans]|uniref:hypothetical protein n=1 Tax=Muricoccus radiodurans TaxID=2231721 RepID=UPI003CF8FC1A